MIAGHLWKIGEARFGSVHHLTPVYFARRLHHSDISRLVREQLRARAPQYRYPVLTSTRADGLPTAFSNAEFISLHEVLDDSFSLDPSIMAARLYRMPLAEDMSPLKLIGHGREVIFYGKTYRFPKGVKQRRIICYLYGRYLKGDLRVSADEIVADLEMPTATRFRDVFKDNPAWGALLIERNGTFSFRWPEKE